MSDLVQRLRAEFGGTSSATFNLMAEAADRIEQLEAALREIIKSYSVAHSGYVVNQIARAALAPEQDK